MITMKNTNREKIKRILAGAGAVLLILMYISTLIFALIGSPNATKLLWARNPFHEERNRIGD